MMDCIPQSIRQNNFFPKLLVQHFVRALTKVANTVSVLVQSGSDYIFISPSRQGVFQGRCLGWPVEH